MTLDLDTIQVKVKPIDHDQLKAIIALDFGDWVVRGFRVLKSQYENRQGDKLWLVPPCYADRDGSYHPIFFVVNKETWQRLEEKLWSEYHRQKEEHYQKQFGLLDETQNEDPPTI